MYIIMYQMNKSFIKNQNYIKELTITEHIVLWLNVFLSVLFLVLQLILIKDAYKQWTMWLTSLVTIGSIFSVMAGAKKRALCPLLGVICSVILAAIAWKANLYGSMIMYVINIIVQACSLYTWIKGTNNKGVISPKKLKLWIVIVYIIGFIVLSGLFAWMEGQSWFYKFWSGGSQTEAYKLPIRIFDAATLMFTIATFLPMVKKYDWVWYIYIIEDICIMLTWIMKISLMKLSFAELFQAITMAISAISMTATCVLGIINWKKQKRT